MSAESLTGNSVADAVIAGLIITAIIAVITIAIRKLKRRKKKDFSIGLIKKKKPDPQKSFNDKFENSIPDKPTVRENMKSIMRMLRVFDLRSPIYNERLFCGCLAKDKLIVQLCKSDRQLYIVMNYTSPEGYYISEDVVLD